eukprot:m.57988 g.57988  ORF g.57988 m.57988 type:complete len:62 (+) comp49103_c1_seq2:382-567(+)
MGGRVAAAAASGERGRKCVNPGLHIEDFSLIALVESSTLSPFLSYLLQSRVKLALGEESRP